MTETKKVNVDVTMVGEIVKVKANGKKYSNRKLQITQDGQLYVVYHGVTLPVQPKEDDLTAYVLQEGIDPVTFKASENTKLIEEKAKAEAEAEAKKKAEEKAKADAKKKAEDAKKKAEAAKKKAAADKKKEDEAKKTEAKKDAKKTA